MINNNLSTAALKAIAALFGCLLCNSQLFAYGPKYQVLRYNENWSRLAEEEKTDPFDSLKYIELDSEGNAWLSLGGQLRERVEA